MNDSKLVIDLRRLADWLENKQFVGDVPGNLDLSNFVGIMREAAIVLEWQSGAIAQLEGGAKDALKSHAAGFMLSGDVVESLRRAVKKADSL